MSKRAVDPRRDDGWFEMACWNALSAEQQTFLVMEGYLPFGYAAEGPCPNGARVAIETKYDTAPGPRFYCIPCAVAYLEERMKGGE